MCICGRLQRDFSSSALHCPYCGVLAYRCMCSMQVVDIIPMKHRLTSITSTRVVQQKHRRSKIDLQDNNFIIHKICRTSSIHRGLVLAIGIEKEHIEHIKISLCICIWPLLPMPMHLHLAKSKDIQVQQLPKCSSCYSYLQLWLLKHDDNEGRKTESFTWNKRVWSWSGEHHDAVVVKDEQAVAVIVGEKAATIASRSVRSTIP
jgi:hypothetical protein